MDKKFKGTKGEWWLPHFAKPNRQEGDCKCAYILHDSYMGGLGEVYYTDGSGSRFEHLESPSIEEATANARLICAAPEMLEVLQGILRLKDIMLPPDPYEGDHPQMVSEEYMDEYRAIATAFSKAESVINKVLGDENND